MQEHSSHSLQQKPETGDTRYQRMRRVTLVGSVIDLILGLLKIIFGYTAQSQALIADGVHSLSDLVTDFMVLIAAKHGSRDADDEHPYGHGRIETMATALLGLALMLVALGIVWDAFNRMFHPEKLLQPGVAAIVVALISVAAKEWVYHYTMRLAVELKSEMLKANAWHSRSDAISSIIVVFGVVGTMAGLPYLDAIAAVGVGLMIAHIAWELGWQAVKELVDVGLEAERLAKIRQIILAIGGVRAIHMLRTRKIGGQATVDVHVLVAPWLSVSEGHMISQIVMDRLLERIEEVSDVTVHIDPEDDEVAAPCEGLPLRNEVEKLLGNCWRDILPLEKLQRLVLHYLDGRIDVDLYLPLAECGGEQVARQLNEKLQQELDHLGEFGRVRLYFG
jgi:cation diffusion facilitator family transporter